MKAGRPGAVNTERPLTRPNRAHGLSGLRLMIHAVSPPCLPFVGGHMPRKREKVLLPSPQKPTIWGDNLPIGHREIVVRPLRILDIGALSEVPTARTMPMPLVEPPNGVRKIRFADYVVPLED